MKNSEVFFDMLLLAGFKPHIDFSKSKEGIYLSAESVNYLMENLHPEVTDHLLLSIEEKPFQMKDIPIQS